MEKSYFRERTPAEIRKLGLEKVDSMNHLLTIAEHAPLNQGLELKFQIRPGGWRDVNDWVKHGNFLPIKTPDTIDEARVKKKTPLYGRARACDNLNVGTDALGFIYRPVVGDDKVPRAHTFYELMEATKLLSYIQEKFPEEYDYKKGETNSQIEVYDDAPAVATLGADAVVRLSSREKDKARYEIHAQHIPVVDNDWQTAIARSYTTFYTKAPKNSVYGNIRYPTRNDLIGAQVRFLTAHDIAAYFVITQHLVKKGNTVPWNVGLFAKPSELAAKVHALCDHSIVINEKDKLRKLNRAERSNILANAIAAHGHDKILYWNPKIDSKFIDYQWNPE